MRAYLAARELRFSLPSVRLAMEGTVSSCCRASLYFRLGVLRCIACRQRCWEWIYYERRASTRVNGDSAALIHVHETRVVDRDGEQMRRWIRAAIFLPLQSTIEPRPRTMPADQWRFSLLAYEAFLHPCVPGYHAVAGLGFVCHRGLGTWTEGGARWGVERARNVIAKKLIRNPRPVREAARAVA